MYCTYHNNMVLHSNKQYVTAWKDGNYWIQLRTQVEPHEQKYTCPALLRIISWLLLIT